MKHGQISTRTFLLFILPVSFLLIACSFLTALVKPSGKETITGEGQASIPSRDIATTIAEDSQPGPTSTMISDPFASSEAEETPVNTPLPEPTYDLSQAGLPACFEIYPGGYGFSGIPGMMLSFTIDETVRTASEFYDKLLKKCGWSGFSTGGAIEGSCGGDDCGPVPALTAGPSPTPAPEGWMEQNTQMWTSGTKQIMIDYSVNDAGCTEITVMFIGQ
jgi:hypothetical protein